MAPKQKGYNRGKSVRRLARERVGAVPASHALEPKIRRKKPKHKKPPGTRSPRRRRGSRAVCALGVKLPLLDVHGGLSFAAPYNGAARHQLQWPRIIQKHGPLDLEHHRAALPEVLVGRKQDASTAHVHRAARARQSGLHTAHLEPDVPFDREALRCASFLRRTHTYDINTTRPSLPWTKVADRPMSRF